MINVLEKRPTISDIAKLFNISPTTVSFILNGRAIEKRISIELAERVETHIAEVGYKPNPFAKSLRTGRTQIIGLMIDSISDPFFAGIAFRIEELASKNGFNVIYSGTHNDTLRTQELIQLFREQHIDGYIICPPEGISGEVTSLLNAGIPVVFFDRYLKDIAVDSVTINNFESSYKAVKHLISTGCKEIGFVTFDSLQTHMQDRLSGYEQAIGEAGFSLHVRKIESKQRPKFIIKHVLSFLKRNIEVDAVLFSTNLLGVCGLKAIRKLSLRIPEDIAVITFDDDDIFVLHNPSVTAIRQPVKEISDAIFKLLLNRMLLTTQTNRKRNVILPSQLISRDSTNVSSVFTIEPGKSPFYNPRITDTI